MSSALQTIDEGERHEYVYDVLGGLRKVLNRDTDALAAEYTYNGINHRLRLFDGITDGQRGGPDGVGRAGARIA